MMRKSFEVLCIMLFLACNNFFGANIKGKIRFSSVGIPNVALTLVKSSSRTVFVRPDNVTSWTKADGSFLIPNVDIKKRWKLIVWDPYRKDKISKIVNVNDDKILTIQIQKLLKFIYPKYCEYLSRKTIWIKWSSLPEAKKYQLIIRTNNNRIIKKHDLEVAEMKISLTPGQYYRAKLYAYDSNGIKIGANIIGGGSVFSFGISDPNFDKRIDKASGVCIKKNFMSSLYIVPNRGLKSKAPFIVRPKVKVKLMGKYQKWYKVEILSGFKKGVIGWMPAIDIKCKDL